MRALDSMEESQQLSPEDARKARRKVKESAAAASPSSTATATATGRASDSAGSEAAAGAPTGRSDSSCANGTTRVDDSEGREDDVSVSVTYFAMPGRRTFSGQCIRNPESFNLPLSVGTFMTYLARSR